jgi:cation transport regulator ChaB
MVKTGSRTGTSGRRSDVPSTVARSAPKAQRTWSKTHDSAVSTYGEGERAHRTAFSALKHSFEKVGDHWEAKKRRGPSDRQASSGGAGGKRQYATAGGVDANASKSHLLGLAARLGIRGRSSMNKPQLVSAVRRSSDRQSAKARRS